MAAEKAFAAGLICIALLSGCEKEVCTEPLSDDAVILAFGDSLTAGVGVSRDASYPSVLQEMTSLTVINAGVSGETTNQGLARLTAQLEDHAPELLVLLEGGNDMLRKKDISRMQRNLQQMVSLALENNTQVLLLAVPEPNLSASPPDAYNEIAATAGIPVMNDIVTELQFDRRYKSDPVHLNEAGYYRLAQAIFDKLEGCGSLP